jgi:plastocyanin
MTGRMLRIALTMLSGAVTLAGCNGNTAKNPAPSGTNTAERPAAPVFHVDAATAGEIEGTVTYTGPKPKPQAVDMSSDPACAATHKGKVYDESMVVSSKGGLGNAFVYISKGLEGKNFEAPQEAVTIDQKGCWFRPRILGVQVGQSFDVTNSDPVTHNIHPVAVTNREWNHSQGPGEPPMHRKFTKTEIMIPVKCNIHDWMHAYIGVVDNPYFAVTKDDGSFSLKNVPPGTYTVTVWQEKLGTQQSEVTVSAGGKAAAKVGFAAKS